MTIFRSKPLRRADLRIVHASSNEPDDISFEVWAEGEMFVSIHADVDGNRTLHCGEFEFEFDADEFRTLLDEGFASIGAWEENLRAPEGTWSKGNR